MGAAHSVENGFGFDPERLWATVYLDDDEAFDLWRQILPGDRIQRRGKEDNYWSMGVPGPCGPCSEIYFDRGREHGADGGPVADEERYLEVWNLVFMQYERGEGKGYDYPILGELPAKNIDTGMGLERMATILQGVENLYEIDISRPVLDRAAELSGLALRRRRRSPTSRCASSPTTCVPARCWWPTGSSRPTRDAATCCAGCCAGRCRTCTGWARATPWRRELLASVREVMSPIYPELDSAVVASVIDGEEERVPRDARRAA